MNNPTLPSDRISKIKHRLRQSRFLSIFMGCPYPAPRWEKAVKKVLRDLGQEAKILDLGSGLDRRTPNTINLEIEATPNVDVVGDGHSLPFKDAVFDAVISEAVLEHVQDPNRVASEIHRVLKPGWVRLCRGAVLARVSRIAARLSTLHRAGLSIIFFRRLRGLRRGVCGTDDVIALDLPRICRAALFLRESALGEIDFVDRGVDYVSGGVAGLSSDANSMRIFWRRRCILLVRKRAVRAMEEIV